MLAKTSNTQTKADFVRSLPSTTPAADVVAKAKDVGVELSTHYVHKVRTKSRSSAKKTSNAGKPTTSRTSKKTTSKAAFVRGLPASTPAKQVVTLARAAGIRLGIRYVYNIRGATRAAAKKKRAAADTKTSTPKAMNGARPSSNSNAETLLKAVAAEIGLGNAIEILAGERARVRVMIGG